MPRRLRLVPELEERDLEGVPTIVLSGVLALFDHLEAYRPLLPEELSTRWVVDTVREARNQLLEERFGRGTLHPALRAVRVAQRSAHDAMDDVPDERGGCCPDHEPRDRR